MPLGYMSTSRGLAMLGDSNDVPVYLFVYILFWAPTLNLKP